MSPVPDSQNKWFAALERIAETIRTERQCSREAAWAYAVAEHPAVYDLYVATKTARNTSSRAVEPPDTQREWDRLSRGLPISKHWDVQVINGQTVGFRRGARA